MKIESKKKYTNLKVLSVYRGNITVSRGTPIRVTNILKGFLSNTNINLTLASHDEDPKIAVKHIQLTKNRFKDILTLFQYVRKNKIDIVIAHTHTCKHFVLALKLLTSAKIVWEVHGFSEERLLLYGSISKTRFWFLKLYHSFLYTYSNMVTTPNDTATKIISKYNENTMTIANGVDIEIFNPEVLSGGYIPHSKDKIVIGYAGNAEPWQGLSFLLNTFETLIADHPDFHLAMLLSGDHNFKNTDSVTVVDVLPHDKVPQFTAQCDILVIPRPKTPHTELALPSKLLEYMAMGKPVVASNTSNVWMQIEHGKTGYIYESDNMESFKDYLIRLKDDDLRKQMGKEAYKVASQYTWSKQVSLFYDKIRELK